MKLILDKRAVALSYDPESDTAPQLVAKGRGYIAQRIIELAKQHGIYVHEDPQLVELLMSIELEDTIPPHLYQVVAKVLAMVYRVNRRLASEKKLDV